MLFGCAIALTIASVFGFLLNMQLGLLVLTAGKPVIDATWDKTVLGISLLHILGTLVPVLVLAGFALSEKRRPEKFLYLKIWLFYSLSYSFTFMLAFDASGPLEAVEMCVRVLNGFVGFYLFATYFPDKASFKWLLLAYLIAGVFPVLTGLYQYMTGQVFQYRTGTLGMTRYVGFYHDNSAPKHFMYMTLIAVFLYWSYYAKNVVSKILLLSYAVACLVTMYILFTKAGYLVIALWVVSFLLLNRKFFATILVALALVTLAFLPLGEHIKQKSEQVYQKDLGLLRNQEDPDLAFGGRIGTWKSHLKEWLREPVHEQMFGTGRSHRGAHNDYLRILMSAGIIGFIAYSLLNVVMGTKVCLNILARYSPLNMAALMAFIAWAVDTMCLTPSLYPSIQWYVWGFIGLSFYGVKGLDWEPNDTEESARGKAGLNHGRITSGRQIRATLYANHSRI